MAFVLSAMLVMMLSARAGGGDLVLTDGNGLSLFTVTAKGGLQPVQSKIIISGGFQDPGVGDAGLRIQIAGVDVIPPGSEIIKAVLKYDAQPGNFPPPLTEPAPFAKNTEVLATDKFSAIGITGQGVIEVDVSPRVQHWVLQGVQATNLNLIINVPTGTTENADSDIQHIDPKSVRLEIKYGDELPQYRLPAPVVEKIMAEQDRTISLWWQPALPAEQVPGEKYWYEFEMLLLDDLWQKEKSLCQERRIQYDRWQTARGTNAEIEKLMKLYAAAETGPDNIHSESVDNVDSPKILDNEAPAEVKTMSLHWTNMVAYVPPLEPKAFTNQAGEWVVLDQLFPQVWINRLAVEESHARLNLGPNMARDSTAYKFRLRVRCSNGQVGPWAETPEVRQRNPGWLVWSSRACYRGRYTMGNSTYNGDDAFALNVYDQEFGVRLEAAKDEYEPFQVFFKNDQLETVQVELRLSDLKGEKGIIPAWAMYPHLETWIARTEGRDDERRPVFPPVVFVDPLAPLFNPYDYHPVKSARYTPDPVPCLPGLSVGWWVDIKVPGSTPAGVYRGAATLVVDGKTEINVPVEMEVWDFFMPRRRTLSTTMGDTGPDKNRAASFDRWLKMMHEHRAGGFGARVRGYVNIYDPDPNHTGDEVLDSCYWDHYIRTIRPYVDGSLFEDGVPIPKVGLTDRHAGQSGLPVELAWPRYSEYNNYADQHKIDMQFKYLRELRLIAKRMGFLEKIWFYGVDELHPNSHFAACEIINTFVHFKRAIPEAKNMVTTFCHSRVHGWLTAYNTSPSVFQIYFGWFLPRQELGEEYWLHSTYGFLTEDNSHMDQRMVPWYGWCEGAANWHNEYSNYGADWDWSLGYGYSYPLRGFEHGASDSGFAPSLQLQLYREGMEDIELCALAVQAVGYQPVRKIFLQCCWADWQGDPSQWVGRWQRLGHFHGYGATNNYNADPRSVYKVRRELAALIAKHKPDDGSAPQSVSELIASARKQQEKGELLPALQTVKQALQKAPADMDAGALEVACYHAMQMPQEALESALRMVRRNESAGFAWKTLGDTCALLSRFEDAQHCWQRALAQGLSDAQAQATRAAIAASSLEGARVAGATISRCISSPVTTYYGFVGRDLFNTRKWPQFFEGASLLRGLGPDRGRGDLEPTPAGLPSQLVHIDLGDQLLPENAKIRRAMIVYRASDSALKVGGNMAVYAILKPWLNEHMTIHEYDKDKSWAELFAGKEGEDRGPLYAPTGSAVLDVEKGEVRLDITRNFRDWVEGRYPNFGLALVPQGMNITTGSGKLLVYYTQD